MERWIYGRMDVSMDRLIDEYIDGMMDVDEYMERWIYECMNDKWIIHGWKMNVDENMERWIHGWNDDVDENMERWIDGSMDTLMNR